MGCGWLLLLLLLLLRHGGGLQHHAVCSGAHGMRRVWGMSVSQPVCQSVSQSVRERAGPATLQATQ